MLRSPLRAPRVPRLPAALTSRQGECKALKESPPRWCSASEGFVSMEAGGILLAEGVIPPVNELCE